MRNATRKKLSLVDMDTKEVLAEGFTPFIQGYADGLLDALDGTIGSIGYPNQTEQRFIRTLQGPYVPISAPEVVFLLDSANCG